MLSLKIESHCKTDVGQVRQNNEDNLGYYESDNFNLYVVCDGMGGYKGGATASKIAVDTIIEHFKYLHQYFNEAEELKKALNLANDAIINKALQDSELTEMGSTSVILLIKDKKAFIAHVGDSRIYLIRNGKINQITKDHSLVQQMVDAGMISKEAAKTHPKKNIITKSLGPGNENNPSISTGIDLFKNDTFVLCTDGLTGHVDDSEIFEFAEKQKVDEACESLINLANKRGGKDNITVQLVKILSGPKPILTIRQKNNYVFYGSIAVFVLALLIAANFIFHPFAAQPLQNVIKNDSTKVKDSVVTKIDTTKKGIVISSKIIETKEQKAANKNKQKTTKRAKKIKKSNTQNIDKSKISKKGTIKDNSGKN